MQSVLIHRLNKLEVKYGTMFKIIALLFVATVCQNTQAAHFDRCGIVRQLKSHGFPENKLRDWTCLVEAESSGRTDKVNTNNNGSRDYGLFQINDKYWCTRSGAAGNDCHVKCSDLLSDDISKAAACAKKVYARHGFAGWYGWKNKCQGALPDINYLSV